MFPKEICAVQNEKAIKRNPLNANAEHSIRLSHFTKADWMSENRKFFFARGIYLLFGAFVPANDWIAIGIGIVFTVTVANIIIITSSFN